MRPGVVAAGSDRDRRDQRPVLRSVQIRVYCSATFGGAIVKVHSFAATSGGGYRVGSPVMPASISGLVEGIAFGFPSGSSRRC